MSVITYYKIHFFSEECISQNEKVSFDQMNM